MFQIDLSASGELLLYMPGSRTVEISATEAGLSFIKKIVLDHRQGIRNQPGYIGTLPTQHAVNKFLKAKREKEAKEKEDAAKERAARLGVDLDKFEILL